MSNLLEKASIILTPTAYSDGDLHCIKPNTATGDFDFTRSTTATRINSSGNVESVAANLPRIDYTGGTGQILLEPQSTNLLTYSEDFTEWAKNSGTTLTENNIISPDGTQNATLVVSAGSGSRVGLNTSIVSGTTYTFSVYLKNNGGNTSINIGSHGTTQLETVTINNDWNRYTTTFTASSTTTSSIRIISSGSSINLHSWGAQLEALSFPTSYIPTSGSTSTRNADAANNSGSSSLINGGGSGEGVIYAEIAAFTSSPGVCNISLSDNNQLRRIVIGFGFSANQILCSINNGSTFPNFLSFQTITDVTAYNKIALKYKLNDISLYINGVEVATDTSSTIPTLQSLQFDNGYNGASQFFGNVKCVAVYKEALTDAELTCLTT